MSSFPESGTDAISACFLFLRKHKITFPGIEFFRQFPHRVFTAPVDVVKHRLYGLAYLAIGFFGGEFRFFKM